jgi:ubiquinone/menaquinone biosynthesis C-methylase UbiE
VRRQAGESDPKNLIGGNVFDKYRSRNLVHRYLMDRFLSCATDLLTGLDGEQVLEVGCGEGDLADALFRRRGHDGWQYVGIDLCPAVVRLAQSRYAARRFETANVYDLPFADRSFDLVIACEILEHLETPEVGLKEIHRVCRRWLLLSVPWEPTWRIANMLRGKYLAKWGNTPGHVQAFSRRAIRKLVRDRFDILGERRPFPWTMLLCRPL